MSIVFNDELTCRDLSFVECFDDDDDDDESHTFVPLVRPTICVIFPLSTGVALTRKPGFVPSLDERRCSNSKESVDIRTVMG